MKLLLDTHIILWALDDNPRLPSQARSLIMDAENDIYYSSASVWETTIKYMAKLFSVFQTELTPNVDSNWKDIYYLIGNDKNSQDLQFIPLAKEEVDLKKHFPIKTLFDSVEYRKATESLEDERKAEIDKLQETFKEISIPMQLMETDDKNIVAIVFERINRAGVPLESFQLLTAWSWSTDFDLQEKLDDLSAELSGCGFNGLAEDQDLLMKCFTGYILGNTSPSAMMELSGEEIRDNFDKIKNGLKASIDFLQKELHLYSLSYIPYPAMIVSLVKFFGTDKVGGQLYNDKQRKQIIKWFWKSCFSRRYSSGVNDAHQTDLNAMTKLREDEDADISTFKCDIFESFFTDNQFNVNTVNTKTFIALLASKAPKSFISGAKVDLSVTLKLSNAKEFHHIFPDKYLQSMGKERRERYQLANFCFLNNADNQKIKDKAPAEYAKYLNPESIPEILCAAICPENTFSLSYDEFIDKRKKMLTDYAKSLIE